MMMGEWGARWVRSRLEPDDLDVTLRMWDMHRTVRPEHFPARRVVVGFELADVPRNKRRWWLVSEGNAADLCVTDLGYDVDLLILADLRTMTAIWTEMSPCKLRSPLARSRCMAGRICAVSWAPGWASARSPRSRTASGDRSGLSERHCVSVAGRTGGARNGCSPFICRLPAR
jgi:hypothetical protein